MNPKIICKIVADRYEICKESNKINDLYQIVVGNIQFMLGINREIQKIVMFPQFFAIQSQLIGYKTLLKIQNIREQIEHSRYSNLFKKLAKIQYPLTGIGIKLDNLVNRFVRMIYFL